MTISFQRVSAYPGPGRSARRWPRMRTVIAFCALILASLAGLPSFAADRALEPGWSMVPVRIIEAGTSRPIVGARVETTCRGSRYAAERPTTDAQGMATVPIYRTWVGLRVTREGYTNSTVVVVGTNEVSAFCKDAVISMGRPGK